MPDAVPAGPESEDVDLARLLDSLANPTRLALLRELRRPRALGEVRLRAEQAREGLSPDRPMSRQGVRVHLDRLLDAGFVRSREATRGQLPVEEYLVNHSNLFAVAEELRKLGTLRPTDQWDDATVQLDATTEARDAKGPRLVVVHGLGEGRAFRLQHDGAPAGWVIGRRWGLPVSLDYDPFVSQEHARVVLDRDAFYVEDLPSNRNGTTVNWSPVPKGGRQRIENGDVVGVGRSLLLFRE